MNNKSTYPAKDRDSNVNKYSIIKPILSPILRIKKVSETIELDKNKNLHGLNKRKVSESIE